MRRISILPAACYAVLLAYACYAWFHVGHWPYYAQPDPKELPHRSLGMLVSIVFLIGVASIALVPVGYLVWRAFAWWKHRAVRPHGIPIVVYVAGVAVWALDFAAEFVDLPWTSTISWLLD